MADVPVVMEMPEVRERIASWQREFAARQSDEAFLVRCLPLLDAIDEWKYASGPLFDPPPHHMELMGFSSGQLLKKRYAGFREASVTGSYAAGFIDGEHRLTVDPVDSPRLSPSVTLLDSQGDRLVAVTTRQPSLAQPAQDKPATLVGISETVRLDASRLLHVGVGARDAYSAYLYRYADDGRPRCVHLFSKGHAAQSNYELAYDATGMLVDVAESNGNVVWPRR